MWAMLCERGADLRVEARDIAADRERGRRTGRRGTRSRRTGRPVHNVIDATFAFDDDGRIVRHQDTFDLWRWSRMALGAKGAALGWTRTAKKAIRAQARKGLDAWMARAARRRVTAAPVRGRLTNVPRYRPEPPFRHDREPRVGVLLVNLGTPDAPTTSAVRRYLAQFLSDPRVVEIPPVAVEAAAVRPDPADATAQVGGEVREDLDPRRLAAARAFAAPAHAPPRLSRRADEGRGPAGRFLPGRSSGCATATRRSAAPSTRCARPGRERILVFPLYPQYAAATTGTAIDAVAEHVAGVRRVPGLRFVDAFHDDPGYIRALAQIVNDYWMKHGRPDHFVLSFHGAAATHARAGRSVPLPVPVDGAPARARARPRGRAVDARVPVALRPGAVAAAPD